MALSLSEGWERRIGEGPARAACVRAAQRFFAGVHTAPGADGFSWEGAGAAAHLRGEALHPADPVDRAFSHLGVGVARAFTGQAPTAGGVWGGFEADGYGFAMGLLRTRRLVDGAGEVPIAAPLRAAAHHGLGRALWFVCAGEPRALGRLAARRADPAVWTGLGLAAVYTGGLPGPALAPLVEAAGAHARALGHGAWIGAWLCAREQRPAEALAAALGAVRPTAYAGPDYARLGQASPP